MLNSAAAWLRRRRVSKAVQESIRKGVGLYREQWLLDDLPLTENSLSRIADQIVDWCKDTMARTRRPNGIDHMAVAVACAHPGEEPLASATFGVFRPVDFYRSGGVAESLTSFVMAIDESRGITTSQPIRFAAALFSWGDVARAAVFHDHD